MDLLCLESHIAIVSDILSMEEILKSSTTWDVENPVNDGIFTISTGAPDFFHQQYHNGSGQIIIFTDLDSPEIRDFLY